MRLLFCKVKFDGLYYWGDGWVNCQVADRWRQYWSEVFPSESRIFWSYAKRNSSEHLIETTGSIFLHPMGFDFVLKKLGRSGTYNPDGTFVETHGEIEELRDILDSLISYIGCGSYTISKPVIKELEVDYES